MSVIAPKDLGILESKGFAHIATIGPHGEPQSNPVWFDWDGTYVRFSQTKAKQKYRNLQQDARIAVSILDPENPYHYLEIRGKVVRVEDDPDYSFINGVTKKYLNIDTYPYLQPGEVRIILVVEPEYTTSQ